MLLPQWLTKIPTIAIRILFMTIVMGIADKKTSTRCQGLALYIYAIRKLILNNGYK